jgi:predicted ATPase/class 3 adenylate cyclase/DNA-binding CsgD family transcriptional regulator
LEPNGVTDHLTHSTTTDLSLPTGVVTFLLTDVEGSTRVWEAGEDAAAAAIARHYELLNAAVTLHGGARPEEQGEGDSVVGAFARPADAVAAALDAQRALADEPWPTGVALKVRMAIHTGEARLRDPRNYFGTTIIRCARLRAIAHGGQTLVSRATFDVVAGNEPDGATLRDLGSHLLKDLSRPEQVFQLCHDDLVDDFAPLRSLNRHAHNLPVQLTTLVGRDAELSDLHAAFETTRLLTLTGAGGCGKTRLALQLAADVAHRSDDGTWWIELAPVVAPELVPAAVAQALGLREEEGRPMTATLAEQLAALDILLVIDNCEQVLDATATLLDELLRAAPGLRVVATSREPLGIPGETTWRVPSLDEVAANELFAERAASVRPGFAPDADEIDAVARICRRLDGIPLAIELAAARTRMMSPTRIAAALDEGFRVLTGGARTVMPRQQTLEACIAWSHDLLDADERALFRRLAVFAGGFTLEAAEVVGADDALDAYAVLDLVARLVDKSLVHVEPGEGRYRLLDTIRLYARERLADAHESDVVRQRHLGYFVDLAEQAEPALAVAEGPVWLAQLEVEHDNLRVAMEWADASREQAAFLRLVTALTLFFELRGHLAEGGRWFSRALAGVGDAEEPSVVRARALWGAAHVAVYGYDYETAATCAPAALAMAEEVGDAWAMARALNTIGYLQLWTEPEPARVALTRSAELGHSIGDNWSFADGLKMITAAWFVQEDHVPLVASLEDLREVAAALGNGFFLAWYHCGLAWVAAHAGDFDEGRRQVQAAIEYCDTVGEPATGGIALATLAEIEILGGECDAAEARLSAFLQRAAATGGELALPFAVIGLAAAAVARGDAADAHGVIAPLVQELRPAGLPTLLAWALLYQGQAHALLGDDAAAVAAFTEARAAGASVRNQWMVAGADFELAEVARRAGEVGRAEDLHHAALRARVDGGWRPGVVQSLEALRTLAADLGSIEEAARLLGAASAARDAMGLARTASQVASCEGALARVKADDAWAEGEALTLDDAVKYASRARGERKRPSSGWDSLTPTELQVVELASQGLTNPQIAERLFIARGTVKVHLSHIFAKLSVATRAELAAAATRREAGVDARRR